MIPWPEPPVWAAIIAAAAVSLGAWLTWLASGASRLQQRIDKLEDRQVQSEQRISALEGEKRNALDALAAAASFINRIGLWIVAGCRGPWPQPPEQITEHIDAELWETSPGCTD